MNNVVSLTYHKYEKQYKEFYSKLENVNMQLKMVGTAPKSMYEFKQSKTG